jgi:uncharacterized protein (DUF362 family)
MNRRDFVIGSVLAGLGASLFGCRSSQTPATSHADGKIGNNRWQPGPVNGVDVAVAKRATAAEAVTAALSAFGGMTAFVKPGDRVLIKPNLAWSRTPEQGACTSPEVLTAVIAACRQAGAKNILVADHACDSASISFDLSGAKAACAAAGVELVDWSSKQLYQPVQLVKGQTLKDDLVPADLLDCDVYINVPALKAHSATVVSLALKNQMGCVFDRQKYHSQGQGLGNLQRNIVDLATALRPTLNILDGMRALKTNGPKGPGLVEEPRTIVVSPDIVALDAYGTRMLGYDVGAVPHIVEAAEAGIGVADLNRVKFATSGIRT